jgi:hypothetical protein
MTPKRRFQKILDKRKTKNPLRYVSSSRPLYPSTIVGMVAIINKTLTKGNPGRKRKQQLFI